MTVQANKAVFYHLIDGVVNSGNLDLADELVRVDFVDHYAVTGSVSGLAGFKQGVAALRGAFPDFHITIHEVLTEGDKLAVRLSLSGTHSGVFVGVPATGKKVTWSAIGILRVEGGKLAERWLHSDMTRLLAQLGTSSEDGATAAVEGRLA